MKNHGWITYNQDPHNFQSQHVHWGGTVTVIPFAWRTAASRTASTELKTLVPSDKSIGSALWGTMMLIDWPGRMPSGTVTFNS